MQHSDGGEYWESTVEGIDVARWTAVTGGTTLVRLRLTNDGKSTRSVRIVEEVPDAATGASLITTTSDEADCWRHVDDRIVHEFAVPVGEKRTSAYLLKSDEEPPLSLTPPSIENVEPLPDGSSTDEKGTSEKQPNRGTSVAESVATTGIRPGSPFDRQPMRAIDDDGSSDEETIGKPTDDDADESETSDDEGLEASESTDETETSSETNASAIMNEYKLPRLTDEQSSDERDDTVVDDLLDALEEATPSTRRALRNELGANERERARLEYVQSRLDDLAAYIDALEALLDEEGIDVVDELKSAIDDNASRTEIIEEDLATVEASVDRRRVEVDESIEAVEREVEGVQSAFDERLDALESELESVQSTLSALEDEVQSDRQSRAREVRRFDRSLSEIDETIEHLQATVSEGEAFRKRFTDVFTSGSDHADDAGSSGRVDPGTSPSTE